MKGSIHEIPVRTLDGRETTLAEHAGKVLLVVNVASECGFTPQYADLEALWRTYRDQGLVVLGFPCNQFGGQEPGSSDQIASFCSTRFDVSFPMFEKVEVNGSGAHPLFVRLTEEGRGLLGTKAVKWNFTKWLIGKDGAVITRFAPSDKPLGSKIRQAVEQALAA